MVTPSAKWRAARRSVFSCAVAVSANALAAAPAADNAVLQWNEALLQAIRITHPGPPIVARALFVAHTCMYDAWAAYSDEALGTQHGALLRQPKRARTRNNKTQAISHAAYRAAVDLFPSEKPAFDALMVSQGFDPGYNTAETSTPAGIGNTACAAVLAFRHADGANQLGDLHAGAYSDYTGYAPVNTATTLNDPNRWQPLAVSDGHGGTVTQKYIAPFWGRVKPFALQSIGQYSVKPPALAGSAAYKTQVDEVLAYSAGLTDRQKVIAEYWADGPSSELPPGHWNLFAQFVSRRDHHRLDRDVKMFFVLNNALMDASVWTWGVKRVYDYVRPISAIHHLYADSSVTAWAGAGMGTQAMAGAQWKPYQAATVVTPPFAEYVSGHSTFSAASATALRLFKRSDRFGGAVTIGSGSSRVEPGAVPAADVVLSWPTFSAAADEAGLSRRFGGIHFADGDLEGRRVGKLIGAASHRASMQLIRGNDKDDDDGDDD
jgi:hypothetical protein